MSNDRERERERLEEEIGKKIKRTYEEDQEHESIMRMRHNINENIILGTINHTNLNTITPCAACKLLRRRCAAEECPFSPYFSPHEPHKFAAVHKVFGASNVSKLLMEVPESQRADAANSLVYEANLRIRDPVYGCMGAISSLQQQIQSLQAQLIALRELLFKHKYEQATATINASQAAPPPLLVSSPPLPPPSPTPHNPRFNNMVSSSSSSSNSTTSLYTTLTSTAVPNYTCISSDVVNVPYFD